jgi:hypothetical protein
MVETIAGLNRFLSVACELLKPNGQVLLDSLDVSVTENPEHHAYHDAMRKSGRYIGEIRMQIQFGELLSPMCGWLQVDPVTLKQRARMAGWQCETLVSETSGDYLARLTRTPGDSETLEPRVSA